MGDIQFIQHHRHYLYMASESNSTLVCVSLRGSAVNVNDSGQKKC